MKQKIIIEVENERFTKNDLLIFNGQEFVGISKQEVIQKLGDDVDTLQKEIAELKVKINDKLKEYHEILQVLTKEG